MREPCYDGGGGAQTAMFDFAWSEIALIGIVALVAIGPKDLPVAIKAVAGMVKKARRMAGEFQTHVDEMVREANLHEVRDQFNDLRRMDIKGQILSAVDADGSLRRTIAENPLDIAPAPPVVPVPDSLPAAEVGERPLHTIPGLAASEPPAFVPPAFVPPPSAVLPPAPIPPAFVPPAFIPPEAVHQPSQHA